MAEDDAATVVQGNTVIIPVLANDDDQDGDVLSVQNVRRAKGVVRILEDGTLLYRPTPNFVGEDAFEYTITDGKKGKASAWVRVQVRAAQTNLDPVAYDATFDTQEEVAFRDTLPAFDADGDDLTYSIVNQGTKGTAVITDATTNEFTYTPDPDANGQDSFTFRVYDGATYSNEAIVTITIEPVNDAPVITSAASTTATEDVPFSYTATATDVDGDVISFTFAGYPTWLSADGATLAGTPGEGDGDFAFTITADDNNGGSVILTVSVTVVTVNDIPVADAQSVTTAEDTPVSITLTGSDPDGDALAFAVASDPADGSLSGSPPNVTYSPNADFNGGDSFTFTVDDSHGGSASATVSITVTPVNDAPVAVADTFSVPEDSPVRTLDVLANDIDVDGDDLIIINFRKANGILHIIDSGKHLSYEPTPNFSGEDVFFYTISDPSGLEDEGMVTVVVSGENDAPVFTSSPVTAATEGSVYAYNISASDDDAGAVLTISAATLPGWLDFTDNGDGTALLSGTPDNGDVGDHAVVLTLTDGVIATPVTQSFTISVSNVNDPPVAADDEATTEGNTPVTIPVLVNDSDPDGDVLSIASISQPPAHGTAEINADGTITYSPDESFNGTDTFTYTASDGSLSSNTATVTITVNLAEMAESEPIGAEGGSFNADFGDDLEASIVVPPGAVSEAINIQIGLYDTPPAGANLAGPVFFFGPSGATFDPPVTVTVSYDPGLLPPGFDPEGLVLLIYSEIDGTWEEALNSEVDTDAYTVTGQTYHFCGFAAGLPLSRAPYSLGLPGVSINEDAQATTIIQDLTNYFADPNFGDQIDFDATSPDKGLHLVLVANDSLIVEPRPNFNGEVRIVITATDLTELSVSDTLLLTVISVNDAPKFIFYLPDLLVPEDVTAQISLADIVAAVIDVDGDPLSFSAASDTLAVTAAMGDTVLTLIPAANWNGSAQIVVSALDGQAAAQDTFTLTVGAVNDAPSAFTLLGPANDAYIQIETGNLDDFLTFAWEEVVDPDGDDVRYTFALSDSGGTVYFEYDTTVTEVSVSYADIAAVIDDLGLTSTSFQWTIVAVAGEDMVTASNGPYSLTIDASTLAVVDQSQLPQFFTLHQNYPNPFNPVTTLQYELPHNSRVLLVIYDMRGREVIRLVDGYVNAGHNKVVWNSSDASGRPVPSGIYFARLVTSEYTHIIKMSLIR